MRIELMLIGDELLTGEVDPYPVEMIKTVRARGAYLSQMAVVEDDLDAIVAEIEAARARGTELLVVTGGLGPTLDDVTRHALAKYLDAVLEIDPEAQTWLEGSLRRMHGRRPKASEQALLMAKVPKGSKALRNPVGAACGIDALAGEMRILCLPGFPKEMMAMFALHVLPCIVSEGLVERELRIKLRETTMEPLFQQLVREFQVRIASLPKEDWREKGNVVVIKGRREEVERAADLFLELVQEKEDEFLD